MAYVRNDSRILKNNLNWAHSILSNIQADLENHDSAYYQKHFLNMAERLTAYLGGPDRFTDWFNRVFPPDTKERVTWKMRLDATMAAVYKVENKHTAYERQEVVDALNDGTLESRRYVERND
jgi:hypothetical protein